ncbi:hypothetical protein LTR86_006424 [Recurvomyces mirabilis]|nr:hypothetical protein LTR86_006424 [Recurvomyces mirabilis]
MNSWPAAQDFDDDRNIGQNRRMSNTIDSRQAHDRARQEIDHEGKAPSSSKSSKRWYSALPFSSGYAEVSNTQSSKRSYVSSSIHDEALNRINELEDALRGQHELQRRLQAAEAEIHWLRGQNIHLKKSIAESTRNTHQPSDSQIKDDFNQLFYKASAFARRLSGKVQIDIKAIEQDDDDWIHALLPCYQLYPRDSSHWTIMGIISRTIVKSFQTLRYFGVAKEGPVAAAMNLVTMLGSEPTPDERRWLCQTMAMLNHYHPLATADANEALVQQMTKHVDARLSDVMQLDWSKDETQEMAKIFRAALSFVRMLHNHSATFRVATIEAYMKHKTTGMMENRPFNAEVMQEMIEHEDEDKLAGRPLAASVFPIVFRCRDELGNNLSREVAIVRARVVVPSSPPMQAQETSQNMQTASELCDFVAGDMAHDSQRAAASAAFVPEQRTPIMQQNQTDRKALAVEGARATLLLPAIQSHDTADSPTFEHEPDSTRVPVPNGLSNVDTTMANAYDQNVLPTVTPFSRHLVAQGSVGMETEEAMNVRAKFAPSPLSMNNQLQGTEKIDLSQSDHDSYAI